MTPIRNAGEAEQAIASLNIVLDELMQTVEAETARVRAGHLRHATELQEKKAELAGRYAAESECLKAARDLVAKALPQALPALRQRHEAFQALLKTNLTVIATAHAVSEGIIRGVSGELARKRAPSTYGATGKANTLPPRAGQPLAVSRSL